MKFSANSALTEYEKPCRGAFGALFSRALALLIIAVLVFANAGLAFAGEASAEPVLAGPAAEESTAAPVQPDSVGEASSVNSTLAGAGSGQGTVDQGSERTDTGAEQDPYAEDTIGSDTDTQGDDTQSTDMQDAEGRDVTIHFGEGEGHEIRIHVNSVSADENTGEAGTEEQEERKDAKKEFVYEDSKVRVTATLETPGSVPKEAQFRVTEVTPDSADYNYDAYMEALNEHAASDEVQGADSAANTAQNDDSEGLKVHSNSFDATNTLLYDVAFIMQSYDEDGNVIEGGEYEYQPEEGAVDIRVEFKESQLTDDLGISNEQDVTITHLPLSEEIRESVNTTADATAISSADINVESVKADSVTLKNGDTDQADFQMESFSVISFSGTGSNTIQATPFSSLSIEDLLGESIIYGVTANIWHFTDDSETSFAVGTYCDSGNDDGSNSAKSNGAECQYIMVGKVEAEPVSEANSEEERQARDGVLHLKGYKAYIKSPYSEADGKIQYGTSWSHENMVFTYMSESDVRAAVSRMIAYAQEKSTALKGQNSIANYSAFPDTDSAGQYTLDFTGLDDGTYCIDVSQWPALKKSISINGGLTIKKNSTQKIVFNFPGTENVKINKYAVYNDGVFEDSVTIANHTTADSKVAEDIIFNVPNAGNVELTDFSGVLLAPAAKVDLYGTGGGWVICDNFNNHNEWHYLYHKVYEEGDSATFQARKRLNGKLLGSDLKFRFRLEEKDSESETGWTVLQEDVVNDTSWIRFAPIEYDSRNCPDDSQEFVYRITEQGETTEINGRTYINDTNVYYAKVTVTRHEEGTTVSYTATHPVYYSDENCTNELTTVSSFPEFENWECASLSVEKKWFLGTNEVAAPIGSIGYKLYRHESPVSGSGANASSDQSDDGEEEMTHFKINVLWATYEGNQKNYCSSYQVNSGDTINVEVTVPASWQNVTLKPRQIPGEYWNDYAGDVPVSSREVEGDLCNYVFSYTVPSIHKVNGVNLKEYDLILVLNYYDTSGMKIPHTSRSTDDSGESSAVSFEWMMTHESAKEAAQAQGDTLVGSYTLSADNGWKDTPDTPLPVSGRNSEGEIVYYSYYVVEDDSEDDSSYETFYENNEGITSGDIIIYNKLPDSEPEYTFLEVRKQWKSGADPKTAIDVSSSKEGSINFEIRRVLKYSDGSDVPGSDERYTGGTLANPIPGKVERLEDGTYMISSKEDGVDDSGNTRYVWTPATINNLPVLVRTSDDSPIYTCFYYVKENSGEESVDTTYNVGSVTGGTCIATNVGSTVTIINREIPSYSMPATGGAGTHRIYLVSILLIAFAGAGLILIRRRREIKR